MAAIRGRSQVDYAGSSSTDGARPQAAPRFLLARRSGGGWSLAELVMVIVIGGILTVGAIQVFRPREVQAIHVAERFRDDVRHAQMLAMTLGRTLQLDVTANGYSVACVGSTVPPCNATAGNPMLDPGTGQPFNVNLAAPTGPLLPGLSITSIPPTIVFDPLGRPRTVGNVLVAANSDYTFSGASTPRVVRVAPITGFASLP